MGLYAVGLAALACDDGALTAKAPGAHSPLMGERAPDFDLPAQSGGKRASLEDASGKVSIVDFWATWCGPCRASFPKYEALSKKYADDVVVFGISEDDDADGIKPFAAETGATFVLAWDPDKRVAGAYHPDSMPTAFIVDKSGLVRFVHAGFHEGEDQEIDAQIKGLIE